MSKNKVGAIHKDIHPLPLPINNDDGDNGMIVTVTDEGAVLPSKSILRCYGCSEFGNPDIKRCACQCTYFCSVDCQKKGWANHKQECSPIRAHFKEEEQEQRQRLELANKLMLMHESNSSSSTSFTCSVCLDEKEERFTTIALPCGHHFCYDCIQDVQYNAYDRGETSPNCVGLCPLCRKPIPFVEHLVAERVEALLTLAETKHDAAEERDQVCQMAMELVDFVLDKEPGKPTPLILQGDICFAMGKYDQAILSCRKAYNTFKISFQRIRDNPDRGVIAPELFQERMEEAMNLNKQEPSTDFPNDATVLEEESTLLIKTGMDPKLDIDANDTTMTLSKLLLVMARSLLHHDFSDNDDDPTKSNNEALKAFQLALLVQKINKPMADKYGGCRPVDISCTTALAECYLALGKVDAARALIRKAIQKFRYRPGLHEIMADCEKKDGNLEKALFYAAKGYFYEDTWNEKGTRAKNLKLWNDIRRTMLQQQDDEA